MIFNAQAARQRCEACSFGEPDELECCKTFPAALDEIERLRKENERLRKALVIVDEQESMPNFAQWITVRSVARHALSALEGRE